MSLGERIGEGQARQSVPSPNKKNRLFRCQFCAREFQRNEHLQRHERLHTKEKPFGCTACPETFTRSDLLARHLRLCHTVASSNPNGFRAPLNDRSKSPEYASYAPDAAQSASPHIRTGPDTALTANDSGHSSSILPLSDACLIPVSDAFFSSSSRTHVDNSTALPIEAPATTSSPAPWDHSAPTFGDFAHIIDNMTVPSQLIHDQPSLPLSTFSLFDEPGRQPSSIHWQFPNTTPSDVPTTFSQVPHLFDKFSSTFPSFEISPLVKACLEPWKVTQQHWDKFLDQVQFFNLITPPGFVLQSRHTLTRYLETYFTGFHRHLPFLHIPTFSLEKSPVELILAMAVIGAQSNFEHENARMLFETSYAIIQERLRKRKAELRHRSFPMGDEASTVLKPGGQPWIGGSSSILELPLDSSASQACTPDFHPLPAAQTLLLLMAMATWGNSKAIYNKAFGLQNTIVNLVREEEFLKVETQIPEGITWDRWVQIEGFKRTIAIIYCFLNFHTIVNDTPPPIRTSELTINLPSREADWAAQTEKEWQEIRTRSEPEPQFQAYFASLFLEPKEDNEILKGYSSLGGYTLILALIQHIYFLRELSKCRPGSEQSLSPADAANVEQALRNWQSGWYTDPESSLSPGNPHGPISFNSTALLRMAYIRLVVDVGPWRALNTHNPYEIAISMHQSPPLIPSPKLTHAVLYAAHALSIPVKIGVSIVTRSQAFTWSLQHSLCALECAFVVSKWLIVMGNRVSEVLIDKEDKALIAYLDDIVAEAGPGICPAGGGGNASHLFDLCVRVIKLWAKLLSGEAHWDVVRMIGKVLEAYGYILEKELLV
ncbi:hypothetical protein BDV36DRAFT_293697 [Aspergillus pseudocaelatus]|uniref:C2H2-type domain-containing protein n=1 Tax=Aspergillus pseudocaelatus TaxID=1825620 RepID=A0ABQ6WTY1_9EURO|nr:hypothetical protein BDV36DRAFT_293697 [Aspergillus pseudocaelatus]